MSKIQKPAKTAVELTAGAPRPSRIRREPPPKPAVRQTVLPDDPERETWAVVLGVLLFGIAITVIILGASDYLSG